MSLVSSGQSPTEIMRRALRELRYERDQLDADLHVATGRLGGMTTALKEARRSRDEWARQCDAMARVIAELRGER